MIPRLIQHQVLERLTLYPAVVLVGPRQSGKTTSMINGPPRFLVSQTRTPSGDSRRGSFNLPTLLDHLAP